MVAPQPEHPLFVNLGEICNSVHAKSYPEKSEV